MQKAHDSSYNNYWRNYPNISTPIVQDQLNRMETTTDTIDDRVVAFDTTKANQTDYLKTVIGVDLNDQTGVLTFTKANGTTLTFDTDLEKIATNFDYDDDPQSAHYQQLIITLEDGTVKYVDMSALITEYEFADSSSIHFTVTNGEVSASIIDGSVTEAMLETNFLANCRAAESGAESAKEDSEAWAVGTKNGEPVTSADEQYENNAKYYSEQVQDECETAEAWAVGTRGGVPVPSSEEQYHNNAKYWSDQAQAIVGDKVNSFNGRTGTVTSADDDYAIGQITPTGASIGQIPIVRSVGGTLKLTMENPPSTGHEIENGSGTAMTQRDGLQFVGFDVSDDSTNNRTVITDKVFVLTNQTLTFSNLVATISDARVTASTYAEVFFTDATLQAASNAGIVVDTSSGTITFTATSAPSSALVCDIVCRKG